MDQSLFSDLAPVPQDDGPNPLVPIAYPQDYSTAMNYFRAVCQSQEYSERVLKLTAFLVEKNASHYSVWKYRLDTLFAIGASLEDELEFVDEIASDQPKSFQVWHHRQAIADRLQSPQREIDFLNKMLADDSKNYHAWTYRQHVVAKNQLWDLELIEIDAFIKQDVRNNSAWNQRFFVYSRRPQEFDANELHREIAYVSRFLDLAPGNESVWNYLRGIAQLAGVALGSIPEVESLATKYSADPFKNRFAIALKADIHFERQQFAEYIEACRTLSQVDAVRKLYWEFRASQTPEGVQAIPAPIS
eukprot:jgi/Hompol1/5643/HPOL_004596-RA